jgi:hypothetical protein
VNEADVSSKLRVALIGAGAKAMKVSDRFNASRPDLFICYLGHFIVIEMKIHPNIPTDAQEYELTDFVEHQASAFVGSYNKLTKLLMLLHLESGTSASFKDYKEAAQWVLNFSTTKKNCS